ncbi:MAG: HDIG domain-containing protein [Planctomycetes bacterium]|nr:HDIG domain-containing protein [Planctomycetota bacterium]
MDRDHAWTLLNEYTKSASLIRHGLSVEAAMRFYARKFGEDEELWGLTGLLHDFDYERFAEPPAHTREGAKILRDMNVNEEVIGAILSHADWNLDDYPRDRPIRKTLFAVDELCGFLHAAAAVRPSGFDGMKAKSVRKKLKTKSFAAAVSRADITAGAEMLNLELDEHIENCIEAVAAIDG